MGWLDPNQPELKSVNPSINPVTLPSNAYSRIHERKFKAAQAQAESDAKEGSAKPKLKPKQATKKPEDSKALGSCSGKPELVPEEILPDGVRVQLRMMGENAVSIILPP